MIDSNTYSEVYEILSYMDKSVVMKIPIDILKNIKDKRNKNYISRINPNDIFNLQNIKKETIDVLACLDVNFWMNDEKKREIKEKYNKKELAYQTKLKSVYKTENLFKNTTKIIDDVSQQESISIIEYKEKNFLQKMLNKIKHLLKK